jgi:hypothetical protein
VRDDEREDNHILCKTTGSDRFPANHAYDTARRTLAGENQKVPGSIVVVAIILAAVLFPYVGAYFAVIYVTFGATMLVTHVPSPTFAPSLVDRVVSTTGISPTLAWPAMIAMLIFILGLCCIVRAVWDRRWSAYADAATLSLGFLATMAVALLRLGNKWPFP